MLALSVLPLVGSGCGYRVASHNRLPQTVSTLTVAPLTNRTTTFEVEQILTRALTRELVQGSSYRVVSDPDQAEGLLEGEILMISASPVTFGRSAFGSTFLVTLHAGIRLKERTTGRLLFEQRRYIFREQYVINVDVENFFSEQNPALQRIAQDFASSVVASLRENF